MDKGTGSWSGGLPVEAPPHPGSASRARAATDTPVFSGTRTGGGALYPQPLVPCERGGCTVLPRAVCWPAPVGFPPWATLFESFLGINPVPQVDTFPPTPQNCPSQEACGEQTGFSCDHSTCRLPLSIHRAVVHTRGQASTMRHSCQNGVLPSRPPHRSGRPLGRLLLAARGGM